MRLLEGVTLTRAANAVGCTGEDLGSSCVHEEVHLLVMAANEQIHCKYVAVYLRSRKAYFCSLGAEAARRDLFGKPAIYRSGSRVSIVAVIESIAVVVGSRHSVPGRSGSRVSLVAVIESIAVVVSESAIVVLVVESLIFVVAKSVTVMAVTGTG